GAGLRFVGIDHEIMGPLTDLLGHERPFEPRGEAGAAAAAQARGLDLVDDPVAAHLHDLPGPVPGTAPPRAGQTPVVQAVEIGESAVAVRTLHWLSFRGLRPRFFGGPFSSGPLSAGAVSSLVGSGLAASAGGIVAAASPAGAACLPCRL